MHLRNTLDAINSNNQAIKSSLHAASALNSKLAVSNKTPTSYSRKNSIPSADTTKTSQKHDKNTSKASKSFTAESGQNAPEATSPSNSDKKQNDKNIFDLNLKSFLLDRATKNEQVALCLYWFVKVEIKDNKSLLNSISINSGLSTSVSSRHST